MPCDGKWRIWIEQKCARFDFLCNIHEHPRYNGHGVELMVRCIMSSVYDLRQSNKSR
jgi:hypothetical protein